MMRSPSNSAAATGSASEGGVAPGAPGRVFFSYARSDAEFVLKIASALRVDGVELWVDQLDIPKGARWDESVEGALKSCACLVVVLSPASVASFNVLDEVNYTLAEQKRVVPILLHACEIPFRLKRIQHIDFTAGYERGYRELLAALTKPSERCPPAPVKPEPVIERNADPVPPRTDPKLQPAPRGSLYRHMAAGAALMFFVLLMVGLFTNSDTPPSQQSASGESAPAGAGAPATSPSAPTVTVATPVETPAPAPAPAVAVATPVETPAPAPAPAGIAAAEIEDLVARYIGAHNRHDIGQIVALYDDRVDYVELGQGAQVVSQDKQALYRDWPEMQFARFGKIDFEIADNQQSADVAFTVDFVANNGTETRQGRVRVAMRLRQEDGVPKITIERHRADQ